MCGLFRTGIAIGLGHTSLSNHLAVNEFIVLRVLLLSRRMDLLDDHERINLVGI